ncbi:craniofacial development protein 2-like [Elysia marginata]|uniref:Craniofacial development protein 2-like n=1 Tax=Elysia marginata TaxID=1093978 RepID=A0AAV4IUW7_9GAST|nr:craniofacial development protein 2-like [Elysia marginata]
MTSGCPLSSSSRPTLPCREDIRSEVAPDSRVPLPGLQQDKPPPEPKPMKECGQSRKDSTHPIASSSIKSLRIASWNVRTLYQAGKTAQLTTEMKRYRLHILGVSETHWIQSGQKTLGSGELILFSGREHN